MTDLLMMMNAERGNMTDLLMMMHAERGRYDWPVDDDACWERHIWLTCWWCWMLREAIWLTCWWWWMLREAIWLTCWWWWMLREALATMESTTGCRVRLQKSTTSNAPSQLTCNSVCTTMNQNTCNRLNQTLYSYEPITLQHSCNSNASVYSKQS